MDINLVVLSLGNTRLAIGTFVAGELEFSQRVVIADRAQWSDAISAAWKKVEGRDGAAIAGASVNPNSLEAIEHTVSEITKQSVSWVGREVDLPINVMTRNPAETGVDRILNIAAAYEQMQKACVVVDAGTAITVDCCNDKGEFLGGAIAPGVRMMLDALHEKTAKLPKVEFEIPPVAFGRDTREAMLEGVYYGARGLVKELVENYATELGFWPEIIATGGDAETLFGGWELIHAVSADLLLYGIALAYSNHHIKHGT